jgi:hypothetical protein
MQIRWTVSLLVVCVVRLAYGTQDFVGAEKCGSCHSFAYQVWRSGPHARAHQLLTTEQAKDTKCNTCHTMGSTETVMRGVECESCHGNGKYYHASYVMKDKELARLLGLTHPGEAQCRQCHNAGAPNVVPFDFGAMWSRIDHSREARLTWEASQGPDRKKSVSSP